MRIGFLASHPIQYLAPLLRELATRVDLHVFYAHDPSPKQQAAAGFDVAFEWDTDLLEGYALHVPGEPRPAPGCPCRTFLRV